jgi:hypothetical protein
MSILLDQFSPEHAFDAVPGLRLGISARSTARREPRAPPREPENIPEILLKIAEIARYELKRSHRAPKFAGRSVKPTGN